MRIVSYFGDWICECGTQNRLWDTCECGQAGPCRDWVRGRCKYAGACRYAISTGSHSGTSLVNQQPFLSFRRAKCCPHILCLTVAGQIDVTEVLWVGAGSRIRPSTCQQGPHLLRQLHVQHQVLSTLALCQPLWLPRLWCQALPHLGARLLLVQRLRLLVKSTRLLVSRSSHHLLRLLVSSAFPRHRRRLQLAALPKNPIWIQLFPRHGAPWVSRPAPSHLQPGCVRLSLRMCLLRPSRQPLCQPCPPQKQRHACQLRLRRSLSLSASRQQSPKLQVLQGGHCGVAV